MHGLLDPAALGFRSTSGDQGKEVPRTLKPHTSQDSLHFQFRQTDHLLNNSKKMALKNVREPRVISHITDNEQISTKEFRDVQRNWKVFYILREK